MLKDMTDIHTHTHTSVCMCNKRHISQVKEDNSEIATMERQISEVQEQIRQLQDECHQLDQVRLHNKLLLTLMKGIHEDMWKLEGENHSLFKLIPPFKKNVPFTT